MSALQAVVTTDSEFGFQVSHRAAFIEVGYNFLSALRDTGGKMNPTLKAHRDEFAVVLRQDIESQGFEIEATHDFAATVSKALAKIAKNFQLPPEDS